MKISILKRVLSVTVLMSFSFCASAQDVWVNLFRNNGQLIKVNANRVQRVDLINGTTPSNLALSSYLGSRVDLTSSHFVSYNKDVKDDAEGKYDLGGGSYGDIQACTQYGHKIYHFYAGGGLNVYDEETGVKESNKILACIPNFTFYNVGMSNISSYTKGGVTTDLTIPCVFATGKENDDVVCKIIDVENDELVGEKSLGSGVTSKVVSCMNITTSASDMWSIHLDDATQSYKFSRYGMTDGVISGTPETFSIPQDMSTGAYGEVIDASCFKNQIFLLVQPSDDVTRFLVYDTNYKKFTSVVKGGFFTNPFGFIVDRPNRRFIVLGKEDDNVHWHDLFLDRTKDAVPTNNALSTKYIRMTMNDGGIFQTQVRNLSSFKVTEGDQTFEENVSGYSGAHIDLNDNNLMYYYKETALSSALTTSIFNKSTGADAYQGYVYRLINQNSTQTDNVRATKMNMFTGELSREMQLSCLNGVVVRGVSFTDQKSYQIYSNGIYETVNTTAPLAFVTGYDGDGDCVLKYVDIENNYVVDTYKWTGHTSGNTPSFIASYDSDKSKVWFVGQTEDSRYEISVGYIHNGELTLNETTMSVSMDASRGLWGGLVDCTTVNDIIYCLVRDGSNTKIFVADPELWTIKNILTFDKSNQIIMSYATGNNGIEGTPTSIIADTENQRLIINTENSDNSGIWWNVMFE